MTYRLWLFWQKLQGYYYLLFNNKRDLINNEYTNNRVRTAVRKLKTDLSFFVDELRDGHNRDNDYDEGYLEAIEDIQDCIRDLKE